MQPAMLTSLALTVVKVSTYSLSEPPALVDTALSASLLTTAFNVHRLTLLLVLFAKMDSMLTKALLAQSVTIIAQHV